MSYDFKKQQKDLYWTKQKPMIIDIPTMNFLVYSGKGDPGVENGEYSQGMPLLYGIAYTLKMAHRNNYTMKDSFEYVVPPLEGYWWQEGIQGYDASRKDLFSFQSMIRLPDFITKEDFDWAIKKATSKKELDYSKVTFQTITEGMCVQCLHIGSYDDEPITTKKMHEYLLEQRYVLDFSSTRNHHEIYLSDPRKCKPDKLKTIIRHPIKKTNQ